MKKEEIHSAYWPELCEHDPEYGVRVIPPWRIIEAQAIATKAELLRAQNDGLNVQQLGNFSPHRRSYGTVEREIPIQEFDPKNINCFQYVPAIYQARETMRKQLERVLRKQWPADQAQPFIDQYRNELAHTMYQHSMWRGHGRRIYVLDETTFTLLAQTPLPSLPASILCAPEHAFYLKLPKQVFEFGVWNGFQQREDKQQIEGIMISMDNIDPDSSKQRELAYLAVGGDQDGHSNRNIAFISLTLGPDAKLDEIRFGDSHTRPDGHGVNAMVPVTVISNKEASPGIGVRGEGEDIASLGHRTEENDKYANPILSGAYELGVIIPRVIFGFLLYLQSEHPDIEPVLPAPRRTFVEIRSPKQREAALKNQELRLRSATKLPILYVGRHLAQEIADDIALRTKGHLDFSEKSDDLKVWTLDRQVWVRGHWKRQPYGKEHELRKIIWIRPYVKGPEMAEVLRVRAVKVQKAQAATDQPRVKVTPAPLRFQDRMKSTGTDNV